MTLAQWIKATGNIIERHPSGAMVLPADRRIPGYFDLWRLGDYLVSSVTAGSIWLIPKPQTSEAR